MNDTISRQSKPAKAWGRDFLSGSVHGSFRKGSTDSWSPPRHEESLMSSSLHGLRKSKSMSSPRSRGSKSPLGSSLHGAFHRKNGHTSLRGSFQPEDEGEALRNSYHGISPQKKRMSPLARGREMLSSSSLHGSFRNKDLLRGSIHGYGGSKTHPIYDSSRIYVPTSKGCMKVTTLEESLKNIKRSRNSERDEIMSLLKSVKEEREPNLEPAKLQQKPKASRSRTKNSTVRFTAVDVREYETCISDNPSAADGLPISIDWPFREIGTMKVDEFELQRGPKMKEEQLRMNYFDRYEILRRVGMSSEEIEKAAKVNKKLLKEPKYKSLFKLGSPKRK